MIGQALEILGFGNPWALAALALLPALWLLLRLTPPRPRRQSFPPVALLAEPAARRIDPARTPWWVIVLRIGMALCVIAAAAAPILHPAPPRPASGPLALVIDDSWAAARNWPARLTAAEQAIAAADRDGKSVYVMSTAPGWDGEAPAFRGPISAAAAMQWVRALTPKPWPADRQAAMAAVQALPHDQVMSVDYIADGIDDSQGAAAAAATALQQLGGGVRLHRAAPAMTAILAETASERPLVRLRRIGSDLPEESVEIRALDGDGIMVGGARARFAPGADSAEAELNLPAALRNRALRIDAGEASGPAAIILLDQNWARRVVGVIDSASAGAPLLSPAFYADRALAPFAEIRRAVDGELNFDEIDMVVAIDAALDAGIPSADWVRAGGVLVRVAGPITAQSALTASAGDPPAPARLRPGGRQLGGAMSWARAQGLAPFPEHSPFYGMPVPADVTVSAQVLAEPAADLDGRVWAALADGTPLITAAPLGRGWSVMIHTGGSLDWSNLPLSGLWVQVLRRAAELAHGAGSTAAKAPPGLVLDGTGRLLPAGPMVRALVRNAESQTPGPTLPPGLYGPPGARIAFNLAPYLETAVPLTPPPGIDVVDIAAGPPAALDLRPVLWLAALALLLIDMAASLRLRGAGAAAALGLCLLMPASLRADQGFDMQAALSTHPAYVVTGNAAVDSKSKAGLDSLARRVSARSTARMGPAMAVRLEQDPVLFFPFLYWPLTGDFPELSAQAAAKLNAYMRAGGLIVFDTGSQSETARAVQETAAPVAGLEIGPLTRIGAEHVLTRTFYLLKELPGRWNGAVWSAPGGADGAAPAIVSGNDWAGAWAEDESGRGLYACVPGGEQQREIAFRFGINLVMYALTGNYKADQVHAPAILERLGR